MPSQKNDFAHGSVAKNIMSLAVPLIMAQFINILYNIVDRIFIGRIPITGRDALTGIGIAFPIITIINAFANLVAMGGGSLCSIYRGAEKNDDAEKIIGNSFTMLLFTGVLLTIIGYIFKRPILNAFGASESTFPYANDYISIYFIGNIFVLIGLGMNSFINSQGFGKTGMLTVMLGAAVNLILDPVFIYIFNLGVKGAALATVISQFLSAIWVLKFLTSKKAILRLKLKYLPIDFSIVKRITSLGLSGFVMSVTNSGVQIISNSSLSFYGGDIYITIMTVISSIREMLTLLVHGVTSGSQPVLGYNYGAKKNERVKSGIKFITIVCLSYTIISWLFVMLFPTILVRMFNDDIELISLSRRCVRINFMMHFLMAFQFSGQSTFVGLGKAKQAVFFSLLRKAIIVIPLMLILPRIGLGIDGIFLAEPISALIGATSCYITMILTVYRKL